MAKSSAALPAALQTDEPIDPPEGGEVLELDGVAERRARFLVHAAAARHVVAYEFSLPEGAMIAALGSGDEMRDARAQLERVVALTGGAFGKFPGGLVARIPQAAAGRFEALAKPLIEAFLIGWRP